MRRFLRILLDPAGVISGRVYLYAGAALFLLKYCLDFLIVRSFFGRSWMFWDYLNIQWRDIDFRDLSVVRFASLMLALALPFVWCGVILTLKRLRFLRWPGVLVCVFFFPYVNVVFFLLLAFWPDKPAPAAGPASISSQGSFTGAVLVILLLTTIAAILILFSTQILEHYGWGLFVGIPFLIGFVPGLLHKTSSNRPLTECILVGLAAELFLGAALLLFAFEGLICLLMAAPLALVLTIFGGFTGYSIRRAAAWTDRRSELFSFGAVLLMPVLLASEKAVGSAPRLIQVRTAVVVAAPPEVVWKQVITFSELPPPTEWLFRAGIAHPIRAEISGKGVGAIRHCVFSTGSFVEPITTWDEPRLLQFNVTSSPRPLKELSFREVDPPHLDGFLRSERGEFALTEIAPGLTRLEGTTWYRHGLWPERYWQLWSDYIIHAIHRRVLNHIKRQAENRAR